VKFFNCDRYNFFLPDGHRFPILKYKLLRELIEQAQLVPPEYMIESSAATDVQILRVHTPEYLNKLKTNTLSEKEERRLGLPWSAALLERSRRSVGGTILACRTALQEGVAMNLAGGTHHAYPDHGEGFCVFNDVAIAIRELQAEGLITNAAVIDCDVHQGNGTAVIFENDPSVFTFSVHGASNFPLHKEKSSLDIDLPDGTTDDDYLEAVEYGLEQALRINKPSLMIFLAGADPYEGDSLGRLKVSRDGLAARDRLVFSFCRQAGLPVAVVLSGGYARSIEDTAQIQFTTARLATEASRQWQETIPTA
jgi:acetoin utilization deacetylase AcuC-like enzyme